MAANINEILTQELKYANEDVRRSHLALVDKQDRRELPEALFKELYLPYFAGQDNINSRPDLIEKWLNVAGTGFSEVNLINDSGEVIATVPGLSSTLHLQVSTSSVNLSDACRQAEIVGSQIKSLGTRYFNSALLAREKELIDTIVPDSLESVKQKWNEVFQHFGIDVNAVRANNASSNTSDEVRLDTDVSFE